MKKRRKEKKNTKVRRGEEKKKMEISGEQFRALGSILKYSEAVHSAALCCAFLQAKLLDFS